MSVCRKKFFWKKHYANKNDCKTKKQTKTVAKQQSKRKRLLKLNKSYKMFLGGAL